MSCKKCIPFIKKFDGASIPGVQPRNEFDFCVVICICFFALSSLFVVFLCISFSVDSFFRHSSSHFNIVLSGQEVQRLQRLS